MRRTRVLTSILIAVVMLASMLVMALPALASEIVLKKNTIPDNAAHYDIGDTIHYEIIVQNPITNNATNTVASLIDTLPDGSTVTLATNLVQIPGASNTYYVDYVVDANDMVYDEFNLDKYRVTNGVRATGQDSFFDSFDAYTEKNSMIDVLPSIDIEKYVNGVDADSPTGPIVAVGSTVTFRYVVVNTGNVTLYNVTITDSVLGPIGAVVPSLAPGASFEYSTTALATAGQYVNTGTVVGTVNMGVGPVENVTDSDLGHYFGALTSIDIEKLVSVDGVNWLDADTAPGPNATVPGTVRFKVIVTNTGNVALTGIVVYDTDFVFTGVATSLAPGASDESNVITVPSVIGQHYNLADVIGYAGAIPATDEDPAYYWGLARPSIDIEKLVSVDGINWLDADTAPGPNATVPGTVRFKVIVTNTGNVTLTGIDVDDTDFLFTGVATSLAPGASDESDVLSVAAVVGQHYNLADVIGWYDDSSVVDEDPAYYWGLARPGIDIEKLVSVDGINWLDADTAPGPNVQVPSTVRFKVIVTNTGNVSLSGIVVTDSDFTFTGVATSLAPGASDESDVLSVAAVVGQHYNLADVIGYYDQGTPVTDNDPAYYNGIADLNIDIEKLVSVDGGSTWLDADTATGPHVSLPASVWFKVIVTNNGNVTLTGIVVTDTDFTFTGVATSLAPGASDESDVLMVAAVAGQHQNLASVIGYYLATPDTDQDYAHYFGDSPSLDIEKLVSVDGINWLDADTAPGPNATVPGTVRFKVIVTNTGNVALTGIAVNDTDFVFTGVATSLAPGASDESDVLSVPSVVGQHYNLAGAIGYSGAVPVSDEDPAYYLGVARPSIDIEKLVSVDGINWLDADTSPGPNAQVPGTVRFKVIVTNTGNIALSGIVVNDTDFTFTGVATTLAPGASDESDVITVPTVVGQHYNLADVIGFYDDAPPVTDNDPAHYYGVPDLNIDIEKLVSVDGGSTWLDADTATGPHVSLPATVWFKVIVTNNGNVTLTGIVVTDSDFTFTGVATSLAPGASDESDVLSVAAVAGQHQNLATVIGYYLATSDTDQDYAHYFGDNPSLDLEKLVNGVDADSPTGPVVPVGSVVTFTYIVRNTGNVTLINIVVTDNQLGPIGTILTLAPGASATLTHTSIAVAGQYRNDANATDGNVSDDDPGHYFGAAPAIDLEKYVNGDDADLPTGPIVWAGDTVTFTFVVQNTGNILLTNVVVTDNVLGHIGTIPALTVGESVTLTKTVIATAGQHTNMGTVHTNEDVSDTDPGNYFANNPCIDIEKLINGIDADCAPGLIICGDRECLLVYEYIVTNCGNVPLTNITVDDNVLGHIGDLGSLNPGESYTFTYDEIIYAECGQHSNIGTVVAYPYMIGDDGPYFDQRSVTDFDLAYYYGTCADIDLEKFVSVNGGVSWDDADAAPGLFVAAGSIVDFKFVVTNTGNGTLTYIEVFDDVLGYIGLIPFLEPGESHTFFVDDHVALQGQHTNIGTAVSEACNAIDIDEGNYFGEFACIDIEKLVMGFDADVAPGYIEWCINCTMNYEFIITNCGNVPLTNIVVTDNVFGTIGTIQLLAVGEHVSFTRTAISAVGQHSNMATAVADEDVSDVDYAYYFGALPGIDFEKLVNGVDADVAPGPVVRIGSVVTFSFRVTNTGNIGLENVVINDDMFGYVGYIPMLSVGETETLTLTRLAEAGQHTNLGAAMYCDLKDSDYGNYFGDVYIEPDPDEGMSITWWRNHRSEWVGYSTAVVADDIFNFPTSLSKLAAKNLFEIIGGKIRMTDENATASNLMKAAIAALLNAAHPEINYPMSGAEIISAVNSALASLNNGIMEDLTDELNGYNNEGGSID